MKKAIFLEGIHDYDLLLEGDTYSIFYSDNEAWHSHVRGELAFKIVNTGNGLKIVGKKKPKKEFDYSEALLMYIILREEYRGYDIKTAELKDF